MKSKSHKWYEGYYSLNVYDCLYTDSVQLGSIKIHLNPDMSFKADLERHVVNPQARTYGTFFNYTFSGKWEFNELTKGEKGNLKLIPVSMSYKEYSCEVRKVDNTKQKGVIYGVIEKDKLKIEKWLETMHFQNWPESFQRKLTHCDKLPEEPKTFWYVGDFRRECQFLNADGKPEKGWIDVQIKPDNTFSLMYHHSSETFVKEFSLKGVYQELYDKFSVATLYLDIKSIEGKEGIEEEKKVFAAKGLIASIDQRTLMFRKPSVFAKELCGPIIKKTNLPLHCISTFGLDYGYTDESKKNITGSLRVSLTPNKKFGIRYYCQWHHGDEQDSGSVQELNYFGTYEILEDDGHKAKIKLQTTKATSASNNSTVDKLFPDKKPVEKRDFIILVNNDNASFVEYPENSISTLNNMKIINELDPKKQGLLHKMGITMNHREHWYQPQMYQYKCDFKNKDGLMCAHVIQLSLINNSYFNITIDNNCTDPDKGYRNHWQWQGNYDVVNDDFQVAEMVMNIKKCYEYHQTGKEETKSANTEFKEEKKIKFIVKFSQAVPLEFGEYVKGFDEWKGFLTRADSWE